MLRKDVGLSHYSVMGTLVHILDTQWYWREGAQFGILPIEFISSSDFATVNELRRRWDKEDQLLLDFISGLADRAPDVDIRPAKWARFAKFRALM